MSSTIDVDEFTQFELAGWERVARAYAGFLEPVTAHVAGDLLDAVGAGPGLRLLDVACGPGTLCALAAARGASPLGVDFSEAMVALAAAAHPACTFRTGDAQELAFGDDTFDASVAAFVLMHVSRPELVAAELARVTRPGGRVAVTVWDRASDCPLLGLVPQAVAAAGARAPDDIPAGPDFFRFSDDDALRDLLTTSGLTDVRIRTIGFTHTFRDADELWDGLMRSTVRVSALVAGQQPGVRAAIRAHFDERAARYAAADGLVVPARVKLASATAP